MISYGSAVSIAASPEAVYPYLVELEKQALWSDVAMEPITAGPLRTGSQLRLEFGKGPVRVRIVLEFVALDVNRLVEWRTIEGPIRWEGAYRLEPDGPAATRLSQSGRFQFRGLWRLLEPVFGAEMKGAEIKELEKLKSIVERSSTPTA